MTGQRQKRASASSRTGAICEQSNRSHAESIQDQTMMIMNTMTRRNKKTTSRRSGRSVEAHPLVGPVLAARRGIVTRLDGSRSSSVNESSMPRRTAAWARRRGKQHFTLMFGLNYLNDRRII